MIKDKIASKKLVSIIVPTYNVAATIKQTLLSIFNQTYTSIEIIIMDNNSQDNTIQVIKETIETYKKSKVQNIKMTLHQNKKNIGYAGNFNKGVQLAKGEYIAIYHSDDIYENTIVEKEVEVLTKHNEVGAVFTTSNIISQSGKFMFTKNLPFSINEKVIIGDKNLFFSQMIQHGNFFVCPSAMIKKEIYKKIGLWNTQRTKNEDQDLWLRIMSKYKLAIIQEPLVNYRIYNFGSKYYKKTDLELSPEYGLYEEYINNKFTTLPTAAIEQFQKMKAKGYLFCAIKAIMNNNAEKTKENTILSIQTKKIPTNDIFGIIQLLLKYKIPFVTYPAVRLLIKTLKALKIQKKLYFLNFI